MEVKKYNLPDADVNLYENFFTKEESNALFGGLLKTITWQQDQIKIYGQIHNVPRLTALYGERNKPYSYSGITMNSKPWNDDLLFIKKRIEDEVGAQFTSCLLNYYRHGKDSNGWHQDNEKELGKNPIIGSVSFGETRAFHLRHIHDKSLDTTKILLTHGSFLLMKGTTQHYWKHQIPKTSRQINPRINLTFRIIKDGK